MITSLALGNFRAFSGALRINLAPLTLVYGPNSAGKSSLVKSLSLLQQSADLGRTAALHFSGPAVDLGSLETTLHMHDQNRNLTVGVGVPLRDEVDGAVEVRVDFVRSMNGHRENRCVMSFCGPDGAVRTSLVFVPTDDEESQFDLDPESLPAFRRLVYATDSQPALFEGDDKIPRFEVDRLLPGRLNGWVDTSTWAVQREMRREESTAAAAWLRISTTVNVAFQRSLADFSYIGPLRQPWQRMVPVDEASGRRGVGHAGEHVLKVLRDRPSVLRMVNDSLQNVLETGYRLRVTELGDSGANRMSGLVPPTMVPALEHLESGTVISPVDAGFGLSQLLPIVVEMHSRFDTLICIEQPELHLHPRLQARFGQLLRDAVEGPNNNSFLIETHSEHIFLRIQRLVRDGDIESSKVKILYVDNQDWDESRGTYVSSPESRILELSLSPEGELIDPWPGGFFDERYEELPAVHLHSPPPGFTNEVAED